jgi:hypothetical protein
MAAAAGGRSGVIPATVHVQVRRLQPVLPGARGRAAGRAGHHRVLPGGVEVQVRQPPLHAMRERSLAVRAGRRRWAYAALLHRGAGWLVSPALRCAPRARAPHGRAGSAVCSARGDRGDLPH